MAAPRAQRRTRAHRGHRDHGRIDADATVWHVADVGHTQAFERHPALYRDHVLDFLTRALR